jgi:hypothetical protein
MSLCLEGDIKSCFDRISHEWLLAHVPMDRAILQKWLKSGYMEKHVLHETTDGTPQGGIISPVLCNCALDGLERFLKEKYPTGTRLRSLGGKYPAVNYIRYADDFVITGKTKELLEGEIKPLVEQFLRERGLELSPKKTVVTQVKQGFDFLGQNVRRYSNGKLLIKPSKKNVQRFLAGIGETIKAALGKSAADLINELNPKIRGWANYHRHVVSKRTFDRVDHLIFYKLWQWARRRHPKKDPSSSADILSGIRVVTGSSLGKPVMKRSNRRSCGCCSPVAYPFNDTLRSKAEPTRMIRPVKPTLKNAMGITCGRVFGGLKLFAFSGLNNADSVLCVIQKSPVPRDGAFITASPA